MAQSGEGIEDGVLDIVSSGMPLRRFTFPDEVSGICVYLASDDSTFMTGSILLIDGGAANVDVAGAALAMAGVNWGVSEKVFFDGWKALSRFFDNRMCSKPN